MVFFKRTKLISGLERYDKIVVLIGGRGYVGQALLSACSKDAGTLFVTVSRKATFSSANSISVRIDVSKKPKEAIQRIFSLVGRIDVLVHMAATYSFDSADSLVAHRVREDFEVNTFMPIFTTQALLEQSWGVLSPEENRSKKHRVIVIGSQAGNGKTQRRELMIYSASKAALSVAWEYYQDFLESKGVESIFLKPGGLQKKEARDVFIQELKTVIFK